MFGAEQAAGLYLSQDIDGQTGLLFSPIDKARGAGTLSPTEYMLADSRWHDFSLTADGKMLFADGNTYKLSDDDDRRLGFEAWLDDELSAYVKAIKGLTASNLTGNHAAPEGFLHRKLQRP